MQWNRVRRALQIGAAIVALTAGMLVGIPWLRVGASDDEPSQSIGRLSDGRLVHGKAMPPWGAGYSTYSLLGATIGSQYAHGAVRDTLLAAFAARDASSSSDKPRYVLGEIGARNGGAFHGHRTHQSGRSVDVFMPVRDANGARTTLPTWPWQLFGYGWELDARGEHAGLRIDFEELAAFLLALDRAAHDRGITLERVIIAPEYVPLLLATPSGQRLGELAGKLTRRPVWVRHDEHIHVDFAVERSKSSSN